MRDTPPAAHHLTVRQERFCERIAAGENQTDAWLLAGYKVSREVARRNAAESLKNPRILSRVAELREPQKSETRRTRTEKMARLEEIAWSPHSRPADVIASIKVLNEMSGDNAPVRMEVDNSPAKAAAIAERAARVAGVLSRFARPKADPAANGNTNGHPVNNGSRPSPGLSRWNQ